jgi:hypothetical protein
MDKNTKDMLAALDFIKERMVTKDVSESPVLPLFGLDVGGFRRRRFASPLAANSTAAARRAG